MTSGPAYIFVKGLRYAVPAATWVHEHNATKEVADGHDSSSDRKGAPSEKLA